MSALTVVKKVENCVLYKDAKGDRHIRLSGCRAGYAYLGTPAPDEDDNGKPTPKWRVVLMLPKETHQEAHDLVEKVIAAMIKEKETKVPRDKWFLSDGDDKDDEHSQGHWLLSVSDSKIRPRARDIAGNVIDDVAKIDEMFYSGCTIAAMIRPWYFDGKAKASSKSFPKRIACGISSVFFQQATKPFGAGRVDDSDAWDDLKDEGAGKDAMSDTDDDF